MSLNTFVSSNYAEVCEKLRTFEKDDEMIAMLEAGHVQTDKVKPWMQYYGLFQGFTTAKRTTIVERYASVISEITAGVTVPDRDQIRTMYSRLYSELYRFVHRKLTSAVSKLLWCSFPNDIVIYDAFVENALLTLQGLTPYLAQFPRIGESPGIRSESDIRTAVLFYMNYQDMVKSILAHRQEQLNGLRESHGEQYPRDIRIVDQLLWILGNPRVGFSLGDASCKI